MGSLNGMYSLAISLRDEVLATAGKDHKTSAELLERMQPIAKALTEVMENGAEYRAGILSSIQRAKNALDKYIVSA